MAKLWVSSLVTILLAVIPLAIFYPDSRQTIVIISSLYLISNLAFLVGRAIYRAIRHWVPMTWFSVPLFSPLIMALVHMGRTRRKETRTYPVVIDLLIRQQARNASTSRVILIISGAAYIILFFILGFEVNIGVILICAFLLLAIDINEKILSYRIIHGFYGTNEYEAREILSFIMSHGDTSNFTTGQGLKDILPILSHEDVHRTRRVPGGEGAQA